MSVPLVLRIDQRLGSSTFIFKNKDSVFFPVQWDDRILLFLWYYGFLNTEEYKVWTILCLIRKKNIFTDLSVSLWLEVNH